MIFGAEFTNSGKDTGVAKFSRSCSACIACVYFQYDRSLCILPILPLKFSTLLHKSCKVVEVSIAILDCLDNSSVNFLIFTSISNNFPAIFAMTSPLTFPKTYSLTSLKLFNCLVSSGMLFVISSILHFQLALLELYSILFEFGLELLA